MSGDLLPYPGHARDASNGRVSEFVKGRRREVEVGFGTTCTTIGDNDSNTFPLISGCDFPATHRVVVGVDVVVTREVVEKKVRDSSDVVTVGVRDTTRTQASSVESALAGLGTNQKAWQVAVAAATT